MSIAGLITNWPDSWKDFTEQKNYLPGSCNHTELHLPINKNERL